MIQSGLRHPEPTARRPHLAWLLAFALLAAGPAQAEWSAAKEAHGVRLETRPVAGERFDELRATTSLAVAPERVVDYLFGRYLDEKNRNIQRHFIQRGRDLTLWSDVLKVPMISERCYSMRFERQQRAGGEIRVRFTSQDYQGRTPKPGCIALRSRGEWIVAPAGTGTRLTYISLTDVGGRVPASLVRSSLADAAITSVRKVVAGASGLPLPRGIGD